MSAPPDNCYTFPKLLPYENFPWKATSVSNINVIFLYRLRNQNSRVRHKHFVKSVQIRSFSGPYFPVFSPNTGKYGHRKTRNRKNSVFGLFSSSEN